MGKLANDIIAEVSGKCGDYESSMSEYLANIGEYSDLFRVKRPAKKKGTFSNPRTTEFFRASNTLATLMYRMMTAQEPFFKAIPWELGVGVNDLDIIEDTLSTQLIASKYRRNLLKANTFLVPFGTVICQEDYKIVGVNRRGRKLPVTDFMPRPMDQISFDRGTYDIDDADWLTTHDIVSKEGLRSILATKELGVPWIKSTLQEAISEEVTENTINPLVLQRLNRSGFTQDAMQTRKELIMYYGKLDTVNDGVEYVVGVVNRKHLVRFHANTFQHGKRPFRVAKWVDFIGAWGEGLGSLLSQHHRSMDANRQKVTDNISFNTYNMWTRKEGARETQFTVSPLKIIDVGDHDDIRPLIGSTAGAKEGLLLDELLRQEFRNASGATDLLQAIVTQATTATQNALAQNEALRNISVKAEIAAESLCKEHLEVMHSNNWEFIDEPFNVNSKGVAKRVYPNDMRVDVDFRWNITTDKDFNPARLDKLLQALQIITTSKAQHPQLPNFDIAPLVSEIYHSMGIHPKILNEPPTAGLMPGAGEMADMSSGMVPSQDSGMEVAETPIGNVLQVQ